MTLRDALHDGGRSIHEQVERLLDREDSMIILVDGQSAASYARGFALSATQLELLAVDIERLIRSSALGRHTRRAASDKRTNRTHSAASTKHVA